MTKRLACRTGRRWRPLDSEDLEREAMLVYFDAFGRYPKTAISYSDSAEVYGADGLVEVREERRRFVVTIRVREIVSPRHRTARDAARDAVSMFRAITGAGR